MFKKFNNVIKRFSTVIASAFIMISTLIVPVAAATVIGDYDLTYKLNTFWEEGSYAQLLTSAQANQDIKYDIYVDPESTVSVQLYRLDAKPANSVTAFKTLQSGELYTFNGYREGYTDPGVYAKIGVNSADIDKTAHITVSTHKVTVSEATTDLSNNIFGVSGKFLGVAQMTVNFVNAHPLALIGILMSLVGLGVAIAKSIIRGV